MKIFKIIRKTKLSAYLGLFMLLFSCNQYEIKNQTFDYALYDAFKTEDVKLFKKDIDIKSSEDLLIKINKHYGTDIKIPKKLTETFFNKNKKKTGKKLSEVALENGWVNKTDIILTKEFVDNVRNSGYNEAISIFEERVLDLNLSKEEFAKKNIFINIMKIENDKQTKMLKKGTFQKGKPFLECLWASILYIVAIASVLTCVTWVLCGFALWGMWEATDYLFEKCN